ncbi:serine/threonine protein kinase [Steroidobacter sp. S1-65]|uniref:Serine/threonine protein kinase n=1 Tax=Steroidobacter gossypii TaxID=2805490 RepID=A0ABS1X2K1_9GAMM|nr:serine/threonine-protein kinase [Steroidobacter gossypii]MBM0107456.1 serine/threonine protein kinase [Steroidobacter gossypii]
MQKIGPEDWKQMFELLDTALDLPPPERNTWIDSLGDDYERLKPALRELLAKHASRDTDTFLRDIPEFTSLTGINTSPLSMPEPGNHVGPYRLVRELGRGGMGSVWLAERADGAFKRSVALKLPHVTWIGGLAERMARERDILATLEHPNIARLYDAGVDDFGRPFMAMEFVAGQTIDNYCSQHELTVEQILQLILQVARAVAHAHARLVVHRDLKPSNILVTDDGSVRLLDFGVAKLLENQPGEQTQFAVRAFTPEYAAPEQIKGEPIGTATDVYSLGVVSYRLLTGMLPYEVKQTGVGQLERAITEVDAAPASSIAANPLRGRRLRGDIDAILNRALKKDPAQRYATADAFALDIEHHLLGRPIQARPDSAWYRFSKFIGRNRIATAAAAAVLIAILGGASIALWQAREAREHAARAVIERDIARRAAAREEAVRMYLTRMFRSSVAQGGSGPTTAKAMLDRSAQRVLQEYRDDPYLAGKVVETLADLYGALEDVAGQAPLLEGYLKQAGPEADPETVALAQQKLAHAELSRGNIQRAAELLRPAEEFWNRDRNRFAEQRLEGLVVKARILRAQGDLAGSIATNERAIAERVALSGENHSETAILYNSLGIALMNANRLQEATAAYRKALSIHDALGTGEDVPALVMRANVGTLSYRVGRIADAERELKQAFEAQRALSGDSAAVAASMGQYGSLQTALGRAAQAIPILEQATLMAEKFTARGSALHVQNCTFLAEALAASGDAQRAARVVDATLAQARKQFGDGHFFTHRVRLAQAKLAAAQKPNAQSLAALAEVTTKLRSAGPVAQLALAQALLVQGETLTRLRRPSEALPLLEEAVFLREQVMWDQSWELAEARARLAEAQLAAGHAGAQPLLQRSLATLESQLGPHHPQTARARSSLDR